jgi:hypothetical protein
VRCRRLAGSKLPLHPHRAAAVDSALSAGHSTALIVATGILLAAGALALATLSSRRVEAEDVEVAATAGA